MDPIPTNQEAAVSIFEDQYDRQSLMQELKQGTIKTQKSIFIIGGIFLVTDLLALSKANLLHGDNITYMVLVPMLYAGLGFLAKFKPLLSIILATLLFIGIISMSMIAFGAASIMNGLIMKVVIIYFILTGFRNANHAESARKKLEVFQQ